MDEIFWIYPRQIRLRESIKESSKEAQKILFHKKFLWIKQIRDKINS
jgi:predicted metallo-beta-lactamase superfamily hydrolase